MSNPAYSEAMPVTEMADDREIENLHDLRPVPRISIHAFCETEGVARPIESVAKDRRMAKAHLKVQMGGVAGAAEYYRSAPTPNLIVVESTAEPHALMGELSMLAEVCDPSSKVVVIGHYNDVWLYRELIKNGVSEYMVSPISLADFLAVVTTLFVDPAAEPLGRSIAFIGAKGGVGSSTIAHNVGWTIASTFKTEVIIADMDLPYGTANINFDQDPAQGMAEAVFSPERMDEVYLDRLLATCADNLSLLAAPSMLDKVYDFEAEAFSQLVDVAQRSAPAVVLDIPHVWNGWTRTTLTRADEIVIVASPDLANLRNTKNLVDSLRRARPNDFSPRLVINMVGMPKRPEISARDFAEPLGIEPAAILPFDAELFGNAANNGRMLAETNAKSPSVQQIAALARAVTGRGEIRKQAKAGLSGILNRLKIKK
ncbi:MAG TPA: CpaE family protein [Rhizobiaceae bacterium]|nr:CpaE family protein [Rhizobiaceae bacterium]